MALTYTPPGEPGSALPAFRLPGVDGKTYASGDFAGRRALIVMFICNHCPYVQAVEDRLIALAREFQPRGVGVIGICANDPTDHPDDAPARLAARALEKGYGFPYLVDETQEVARAFGAVCTPDLYLYDGAGRLAYRGRLDDSWRQPAQVKRRELAEAVEHLLAGRPVPREQNPSMGCSIKWKTGD